MSTPNNPLQQGVAAVEEVVGQASALWVAAAEQSDSAEGLGIDGRIQLVHGLVDLWVKGYVAWLEAIIASGGLFPGGSKPSTPVSSQSVDVPSATTYPRQITISQQFVRVGMPNVKIPNSAIGFTPSPLPAGATSFDILLKDTDFIGANYTGTISLSTQSLVPDQRVVTVGL
ncbi:MAG: hypothetical protein ABW001_01580 [Mycobacterium sp.]